MIPRFSTVLSVALTLLGTCAHAVAVDKDVSLAPSSPLEERTVISCCAMAVNQFFISTVCQYMHLYCPGGWDRCLPPSTNANDNQWCRYCIVNHPSDPVCIRTKYPSPDPAPVSRRDMNNTTMAPPELDATKETSTTGQEQVQKRSTHTDFIQTWFLRNEAQIHSLSYEQIRISIIVSATNVVTYTIQNSSGFEAAYKILDMVTGWNVFGTIDPGEASSGSPHRQVLATGGDKFQIEWTITG